MSELRPVVLSGGSGTRLWPLSTAEHPKQFLPLFSGRSLFDLTLDRFSGMNGAGSPVVVTGSGHVGLVQDALARAGVVDGRILVEPIGRNTAPAAIAAARAVDASDVLVLAPSDHLISEVDGFRRAVEMAARLARGGSIVTFGIKPSRAETGYGYIQLGDARADGVFEVARFKEKPGPEAAAKMAADGGHAWNSGMFVATAEALLEEAAAHNPAMVDGVTAAMPDVSDDVVELGESFAEVEADSIDYAIMEKTSRGLVIPIDVGWDDIGSFRSLLDVVVRDSAGNYIEGDVTAVDVSGSFIKAGSRKVAVAGLSDVVVVETPGAVLVVPLDRSQDVRDLSRQVDRD